MKKYFLNVINKWTDNVKVLTIYDQLNPHYAKYYKKEEIVKELELAGFKDIQCYHRHGYSWTVLGKNR